MSTAMNRAYKFGHRYGLRERITGLSAQDYPLNGEWADGPTPDDVVAYVLAGGEVAPDDDLEYGEWTQELCDAFEDGYYQAHS